MSNARPLVVAVFGGSSPRPGSAEYQEAYAMGRLLAQAGCVVMNGGYAGTMEASARGARESGGRTVGILSGEFGGLAPNDYLDETFESQDLFARIREMHSRADAFIVLKGSMGTLAELALVWNLAKIDGRYRKPIVLLGECWRHVFGACRDYLLVTDAESDLLCFVARPEDAIEYLQRMWRNGSAPAPPAPSSAT